MKERRKRDVVSWNRFFWCTLIVVFSFMIFTVFTFSTFRLFRAYSFQPVLIAASRNPAWEAISDDSSSSILSATVEIRETVVFPDEVFLFLKYPSSIPIFTKDDLDCIYLPQNSSETPLSLPAVQVDDQDLDHQIVRCPIQPRGFSVSVALKNNGENLPPGPIFHWDSLVYESIIDRDNTTIVFVKGLNLRPERLADASRFECVYGWDFRRPRFLLRSEAISVAQEIVRCRTPLSVLSSQQNLNSSVKVSLRVKGRGIMLESIARPVYRPEFDMEVGKKHEMCVCTMLRNQARFLREWVMYHARIGVQRWFIYDNNSDDAIDRMVESLNDANYNITRHVWPWIKTQEAGFAHCALRARGSCEWVGFIDVDEFLNLQSDFSLHEILRNQSDSPMVAELRTSCYSFGPSGLKRAPEEGVMVGYTCRLGTPERHKSIVKPEALNSTMINVVHHFHLTEGFDYVNVDRGLMVINHYKYQVWEVFKEKFYRRVATYVADWQEQENVGSKDRAPGLGTKAIEPVEWSTSFCEVEDPRLRDWVLQVFTDPHTGILPWQEQLQSEEENTSMFGQLQG